MKKTADQLAALAHPARLEILKKLSRADGFACCEVVAGLPLAQSTVSQHLKVLLEAGLITQERKRQRSIYRLDHDELRSVSRELNSLVDQCCTTTCCKSDNA